MLTRTKLLASARAVVAREGYENASVDRIAEEAGFSKGAFYSNFDSKEEIILELLETHSLQDVSEIADLLREVRDPLEMIEVISNWSVNRSADPTWGMLALELFRRARRDQTFGERHSNLFRAQWRGLGEILFRMFPQGAEPADPEALGGVVFGLTYGSAAGFKTGPTSGDLVRLVLTGLHLAYGKRSRARSTPAEKTPLAAAPAARKRSSTVRPKIKATA